MNIKSCLPNSLAARHSMIPRIGSKAQGGALPADSVTLSEPRHPKREFVGAGIGGLVGIAAGLAGGQVALAAAGLVTLPVLAILGGVLGAMGASGAVRLEANEPNPWRSTDRLTAGMAGAGLGAALGGAAGVALLNFAASGPVPGALVAGLGLAIVGLATVSNADANANAGGNG